MAVNLDDPFLIVTRYGKGWICVQESHTSRSLAMRRLHTLTSNHYKLHRSNNVPTFYLFERQAFMPAVPRLPKIAKKISPNVVILPQG